MMGYLFLTGATGLLGSYLVRDLLRAGTQLAVLVRSTKMASARHRVETLLARWEKQAGHSLPRPVVFDGDLSRPDLGLTESDIAWISDNCDAVMHNAASLTFHAENRDDEPWRSNLYGTQHVLEMCRQTGIRRFHHVSTAYVCGLRRDRIFEDELDVGQTHGNDYEISKFEAEKLVRGAEFLDAPTIYRPSIIFGDSRTGYTTTFHGFYVPLKLVSTLIKKTAGMFSDRETVVAGIRMAGERLRQVLNLSGSESKNYVPVDWVSAVMAHIYTQPEHHGETYHLTPRGRASVAMTQDVMEEAFLKYSEQASDAAATDVDWSSFEQQFLEGMGVYRSYWRDDPEFDQSNTSRVAPHLPCPEIDATVIMRMCRFALDTNFGWPRPAPVKPELDVEEHLSEIVGTGTPATGLAKKEVYLGLQVNGRGGGQWELTMDDGRITLAQPGLTSRCTATYYLNSQTFASLAKRESTVDQAIRDGSVLIEGNGVPLSELSRLLQGLAAKERTKSSHSSNFV